MSVTFWCPEAPRTEEVCEWCARVRTERSERAAFDGSWVEAGQELSSAEWATVTCDPWCSGIRQVSMAPEINYSNLNARGVLGLLGQDVTSLEGSFDLAEIPAVMQRILFVVNRADVRAHLVYDAYEEADAPHIVLSVGSQAPRVAGGCRVIECGNTDAQTVRRLEQVRDLLSYACQHGLAVSWGYVPESFTPPAGPIP